MKSYFRLYLLTTIITESICKWTSWRTESGYCNTTLSGGMTVFANSASACTERAKDNSMITAIFKLNSGVSECMIYSKRCPVADLVKVASYDSIGVAVCNKLGSGFTGTSLVYNTITNVLSGCVCGDLCYFDSRCNYWTWVQSSSVCELRETQGNSPKYIGGSDHEYGIKGCYYCSGSGITPTLVPTAIPTSVPTALPTSVPTEAPTALPTSVFMGLPTSVPTALPTFVSTDLPTAVPTSVSTVVVIPTGFPTSVPTTSTTVVPTALPLKDITTDSPSTRTTVSPNTSFVILVSNSPSPEVGIPSVEPSNEPTLVIGSTSLLNEEQRTHVRGIANTAGIGSVVAVSPGAAGAAARVLLLTSFGCSVEDVDIEENDQLDVEFHPTRVAFSFAGNGRKYIVAALIMNPILLLSMAALLVIITSLVHYTAGIPWECAFGNMRTPGVLYIPYLFLLQGTCLVAAKEVFHPKGSVMASLLGVCVLIACVSSPIIIYFKILIKVSANSCQISDPRLHSQNSESSEVVKQLRGTKAYVYRFVFGNAIWISRHSESSFTEKYGLIFECYRHGKVWFAILEPSIMISLSLFSAWQPGDDNVWCNMRNTLITLMFFSYFSLVVMFRPYSSTMDNCLATALSIMMFIAVLFMTVGIWINQTNESTLFKTAASCLLLSALLVIIKCIWDACTYLCDVFWLARRKLARKIAGSGGCSFNKSFLGYCSKLEDLKVTFNSPKVMQLVEPTESKKSDTDLKEQEDCFRLMTVASDECSSNQPIAAIPIFNNRSPVKLNRYHSVPRLPTRRDRFFQKGIIFDHDLVNSDDTFITSRTPQGGKSSDAFCLTSLSVHQLPRLRKLSS